MDAEIDAMREIAAALEPLDEQSRGRVLRWAAGRFGLGEVSTAKIGSKILDGADVGEDGFETFADLFHAAGAPGAARERALLAAYWTTITEAQETFGSQKLNDLLKDLGFKVANITDALTQCMNARPAWVVQTRKSGSTKQARKTFKITDSGRRHVKRLIDNSGDE